jgi:hypothetical protein
VQNVPAVDSTGSDLLGAARASERTRCATGLLAWPEEPTSIGSQKRVNICSGASRAVRAAKAERRLWVPKRSATADNQAMQTLGPALSHSAVLRAAKHDEGVYRLRSLT